MRYLCKITTFKLVTSDDCNFFNITINIYHYNCLFAYNFISCNGLYSNKHI